MSDSNSSSAQSTSYTDNRMVLGQDAISANNGSTVYALDGGAIRDSYIFADNTVKKAFDFGSNTVDKTLSFATDSQSNSIAFANDAFTKANKAIAEAGADSMAFAAQTNKESSAAQRAALEVATGSMSEALAYGGKQTAVALDSLAGSAELVKNAYADAKGRGAMTDYLLMAAIGVAALVAYGAMKH